ncbi:MAG TPA: hypothetical protein VN872_09730 [Candidatus Acidoferrum sp.]|nr:hypothetical protein [Candidatus Acidoferrum sp.]
MPIFSPRKSVYWTFAQVSYIEQTFGLAAHTMDEETIVYLKTPPPAESFSILPPSIYWVETRLIQKQAYYDHTNIHPDHKS